ncbi:MAG TPA: hypothetical protein PKY82_32725 [Pyrinomonadaceae bacterium]|jgi:hypothetical protein|nr:hypothetical protein [Pyrinomonadaceae bacterium]
MEKSLLSLKRRHVLGNLYGKCDNIVGIPVYLNEFSEEPIGFVDENLGKYADAFSFHLPDVISKKLASNGYVVAVDYDVSDINSNKYKLNYFVLLLPPNAVSAPKRKIFEEKVEKV